MRHCSTELHQSFSHFVFASGCVINYAVPLVTGTTAENLSFDGAVRWRALALLSTAELLGMSLWFSGSAVVPALRLEWRLSEATAGWLTIAVQLGFVAGTLLSAFLN